MQNQDLSRRVIRSSVDWSGVGLCIEAYLAARFTYRDLAAWIDRIAAGEIHLNGAAAAPGQMLQLHDKLEYFPGDLPEPEADLRYSVAFEDEELLIVDKPGNLCVHPSGPFFKHTLWHLLTAKYGMIHLVNRLDRETSGLLIAAKNSRVAALLGKPSTPIRKEYLALVTGNFTSAVEAAGWLVPDKSSRVRKKRRFLFEAKCEDRPVTAEHAESVHTRLEPVLPGRHSLVRAIPLTGRLHQIRATLFSLGFPLVGDKLYGPDDAIYLKIRSNAISDADRARLGMKRQALHSSKLEFRHPLSGADVVVTSPLPEDFRLFLTEKTDFGKSGMKYF